MPKNSTLRLETSLSFGDGLSLQSLKEISLKVGKLVAATPTVDLTKRGWPGNFSTMVKLENTTLSGSFKIRGAAYAVQNLFDCGRGREIVTASTGNHARSLAMLARQFGVKLTAFLPESTNCTKKTVLEDLGVRVVVVGRDLNESLLLAESYSKEKKATFIPATSETVILGNTSLGLELFEQIGVPEAIYVPLGVGSLATALSLCKPILFPNCNLIGVVPEAVPAWLSAFRTGVSSAVEPGNTAAEGLRIKYPNPKIANFLFSSLKEVVQVSEDAIQEATSLLSKELKSYIEPTGAVAVAALLSSRAKLRTRGRTCAIVTGGQPSCSG